MKFLKGSRELTPGVPFTLVIDGDEVQFPQSWLELASPDDLKRAGIKVVDDISGIEEKLKTAKQRERVAKFTPLQLRRALSELDLRDAIEIEVAKDSIAIRDWWEFSVVFSGTDETLKAVLDKLSPTAYEDVLNIVHSK